MSHLLIYKASAGSGKTFTLAVEYIKHLVRNPRAYRRILAVTFTNKATAEMKERILSQLYGISTADPGSEVYLDRVREDTGMETGEIRERAAEALNNMIHDYSRFRVETIDSFFQSVMRNLARELELSPNLNVELNNQEVLDQAVDVMIEKLTPTSPTLVWLLDYINERIANDKRWNVSDELKRFGRNIFDELYIERGGNLRRKLRDPNAIRDYRKELESINTIALEQMAELAEIFEEELEAINLSPVELKNGTRGIGSYFNKIKNGKLTDDIRNATVEKCLEDPKNWAAKSSPEYDRILEIAQSTLIPLLEEAERERPGKNRIVNSCRLSMQHLSNLQLLAQIDEEVRQLNKTENRFLLSDTNALLHSLIGEGDSSFIFEKIGTGIRHVMIDEFQDTSRMQWGNFRLLLLEGLAQGASSLIVGDVKQSIYRWRNGDWGILNNLNDNIGKFPIDLRTLNTNRRSESNIIAFNNAFFTNAVNYLDSIYSDNYGSSCEPLLKAYQDVVQESPRTRAAGYVKVSLLEPDEENDYTRQTLIALGEEVNRLLASGIRPNDIAILVRKNKNIPAIADYFQQELNCRIVSDEAFRLNASPAIGMMIDALRLLTDEKDTIARSQLLINYRNHVLGEGMDLNTLLLHPDPSAYLPERFTGRTNTLRMMPLYELLEELFDIFGLERIPHQDAYLFAFFDAVIDYLQKHPADPANFVEHWETTLGAKTIPGGEVEGIRIFSIHKSKGLEFHTVLIPFCDWKLENETNNQLLWCSPSRPPYDHIDIVPVTYSAVMAQSVYRDDYLREQLQLWVDNLNLLYVAFTRAAKNLIVWGRKDQKGTVSELLANALPNETEQGELCPSEAEEAKAVTNKLLQKPERLPVKMESARHDIRFRQSNRSANFISGTPEEDSYLRLIDRGNLLHTLFSAITTKEEIEPAIQRLIFEGIIGDKETEAEVRAVTTKAFDHPEVQEWYSGRWRLFNECAIIYKEEGQTRVRRPDRVMMQEGRVVVVDFKFGKSDKSLSAHKRQVRQYMDLLARMGHTNVEGYVWYVQEETIHPIIDGYAD